MGALRERAVRKLRSRSATKGRPRRSRGKYHYQLLLAARLRPKAAQGKSDELLRQVAGSNSALEGELPLPAQPAPLGYQTTQALSEKSSPPSRPSLSLEVPPEPEKRYQLGGLLGKGGLGQVLEAHDKRMGRRVAVKEMRLDKRGNEERFLREALLSGRLEHPSIISIHDVGRWPSGEPFYTMKLVKGKSLEAALLQKSTLAERLSLLPHLIDACEAMAYAHSQRVIHRDLKPANILVGSFGETVVIDWGLAKDLNQPDENAPTGANDSSHRSAPQQEGLTREGTIMGTPTYMPPEQARG